MNAKQHIVFWIGATLFLVGLFARSLDGWGLSLFFVLFFMPLALATSFFFNYYLVPKFLLVGRKLKFSLYLVYLFIISIYFSMLLMTMAFSILADYQFKNLGAILGDVFLLTLIIYLLVFANGFIEALQALKDRNLKIVALNDQAKMEFVEVSVGRKSTQIPIKDILYVESIGNYLEIHTDQSSYRTKESLTSFSKRVTGSFVRIHRSYLVNKEQVKSFDLDAVQLASRSLPMGRTYKSSAIKQL